MIDPFTAPFSRKTSFNIGFTRGAGNETSARQLGALCDQPTPVTEHGEDYSQYLTELLEMRSSGMQGLFASSLRQNDEAENEQQKMFDALDRPGVIASTPATAMPQTTSSMGYFDFVAQPFANTWQHGPTAPATTMDGFTTSAFATMPATCAPEDTINMDWTLNAPVQQFPGQSAFFNGQPDFNASTISGYDRIQSFPYGFQPSAYHQRTIAPSDTIPAPAMVQQRRQQTPQQEQPPAPETKLERIKRKLSFGKSRGKPQHVCNDCSPPRRYDRKCDLHKHSRYHRRENICPEPGCENHKGFGTPRDLERHRQTKHGLGKEEHFCAEPGCKYASKPMSRKDNMQKHMRQKHSRDYTAPN